MKAWIRSPRAAFAGRALLVLLGALLLLWTPAWNGYPLLFSDSGTYLWTSVNFVVPADRLIGYGLFIRATSLAPTLWAVVFAQALGTSFLMFRVSELMLRASRRASLYAFGIVVAIALFTSVSFFVGWIMPDIFASWVWLGAIWFALAPNRHERLAAALILILSFLTHNTHILLGIGMWCAAALFYFSLAGCECIARGCLRDSSSWQAGLGWASGSMHTSAQAQPSIAGVMYLF